MNEKKWHNNFLAYMEFIVNNKNYTGLPYKRKSDGTIAWIATKTSKIGNGRIEWAKNKAKSLGIPIEPGCYAKVMFEIHPTKDKVCQICGKTMSLKYIYPNHYMIKSIIKNFKYEPSVYEDMYEICENLLKLGKEEIEIKKLIIEKFRFDKSYLAKSLKRIIDECEEICRNGLKSHFGPGAMSNFPDRFDGFHTYNRCCRSKEDEGRSKKNLKSYTKDRRAYEYWSDGNIHAANKFMGSSFFTNTSADHIGPISLGFIHDPRYLQPLSKGENSSKRDRITLSDIELLIKKENETSIKPISWFGTVLWEFIKKDYQHSESKNDEKIELYRKLLKKNMNNFMASLWYLTNKCEKKGNAFLEHFILSPKRKYFEYDYKFDKKGNIVDKSVRNITDATKKEYKRFVRVAFEAIDEYHEKDNRQLKVNIPKDLINLLDDICIDIQNDPLNKNNIFKFKEYIKKIQYNLLSKI